jgi:hypothetical protein
MFPISSDQTIKIFPIIIGGLFILFALLNQRLLRFTKLKPLSEIFTTPRYKHSAKITERLGRLWLIIVGIGWLIYGLGTIFLSGGVTSTVSVAVLGLSGLIILAIVGVILINR